jgi:hypothetical protein
MVQGRWCFEFDSQKFELKFKSYSSKTPPIGGVFIGLTLSKKFSYSPVGAQSTIALLERYHPKPRSGEIKNYWITEMFPQTLPL